MRTPIVFNTGRYYGPVLRSPAISGHRLEATVVPALQARFSSPTAIPYVEGARALLHRAIDSGELPADTAVDLLLDSLYGAIVIRMSLSPPGQRAQLAAEPYRYAVPVVDFVLSGLR